MGYLWIVAAIIVIVIGVFAAVSWRRSQTARAITRRQRAMQEFAKERDDLTGLFLRTAGATGKPRGLRWTGCELAGPALFAIDDATGELIALVAATVSFAAIEGGGMEEVEAVGNLRSATAVFMHRGAGWITDGRVIFNLEPAEALAKFQGTLRPLA